MTVYTYPCLFEGGDLCLKPVDGMVQLLGPLTGPITLSSHRVNFLTKLLDFGLTAFDFVGKRK